MRPVYCQAKPSSLDRYWNTLVGSNDTNHCLSRAKATMATHVIQFPNKAEYGRAVVALAEVPRARVGLPGFKMVVEDDHIQVLNRSGIPYADLTKDVRDAPAAPVQS
jgi:hypothetical protein